MKALVTGESWYQLSLIMKAQNVTMSSSYTEAGEFLIAALEAAGNSVEYLPCHVAATDFPSSKSELSEYDVILLSDIGAQTLLLTPKVQAGKPDVNRCRLLSEWVADGGALGMIGGYMSFAGKGGQAGYNRTAISDVLPVNISKTDDRIECPEGVTPENIAIEDFPDKWPDVLGYNRVEPKSQADVWATVNDDPLIVVGDYYEGSSFAFTTDCAEHWAPRKFLMWDYLPGLWERILDRVI